MKKMKKVIAVSMITSIILSIGILSIGAQEKYPTRPITIIVPYGAGGMTDATARLLAEKMKVELGQPIIIENRGGAGGTIGLRAFLKKKPDGYTLCCLVTPPFNSPIFQGAEPFDMEKFKYVGGYIIQERLVFCPIDKPYKTFEEFIAYVKEHPGEVSVGASSPKSIEVIKSIAVKEGLKMKYVLFKSGGATSAAVLGGHIDIAETGVGTSAYQSAKAGKLRILINIGSRTVPDFPEVPNVLEKGYRFSCSRPFGIILRAEVPEYIRQIWEDTLKKVLQDPDLINKVKSLGLTLKFISGKKWEKLAKESVTSTYELLEYNKALEE